MTRRSALLAFPAAGLLIPAALAQHDHNHDHDHSAPAPTPEKAPENTPSAAQPAAGNMPEMACMRQRRETKELIDKVANSFAELETIQDPKALLARMAEQKALIAQLRAKAAEPEAMCPMCSHMRGMMGKMQ